MVLVLVQYWPTELQILMYWSHYRLKLQLFDLQILRILQKSYCELLKLKSVEDIDLYSILYTCRQSDDNSWTSSIASEVISSIDGKGGLSSNIEMNTSSEVSFWVPFFELVRIVDRVIDDNVLSGFIGKINIKR